MEPFIFDTKNCHKFISNHSNNSIQKCVTEYKDKIPSNDMSLFGDEQNTLRSTMPGQPARSSIDASMICERDCKNRCPLGPQEHIQTPAHRLVNKARKHTPNVDPRGTASVLLTLRTDVSAWVSYIKRSRI